MKRDFDSDSDDDDYVPPQDDAGSDSSHIELSPKRAQTKTPELSPEETAEKKRAQDAMWSDFQASASALTSTKMDESTKLVKVIRRFRFAGEEVTEVVEVPEDSPDANKWPLWTPENFSSSSDQQPQTSEETLSEGQAVLSKAPAARPGPRKPKKALASVPSTSSQKLKKLSTLDKSAMDWQSHVDSQLQLDPGFKDELEANRRGGGYLEKVEFLQRVEERKEVNFEANKSSKRRRM